VHSIAAANAVKMEGKPCDLLARIAADPAFQADEEALENALLPENYIGCAKLQTEEYLNAVVSPILSANADNTVKAQEINV
jgi:adenylosuccinate lyase